MPTDWRSLLNEVHIAWTDRGSNSILGHPTIKCPMCGANDPSQHMVLNDEGYYCHRDRRHSGRDFPKMLRRLLPSRSREAIVELLNRHWTTAPGGRSRPTQRTPGEVELSWARFLPAAEHDAYLEYLDERGFDDPASLCRKYDLRYAKFGQWAGRLLIPLTDDDGSIISWTGRAISKSVKQRYDTLPVGRADLLYVPRMMREAALLIEGPIDVLKVAEATEFLPFTPIGILGIGISEDRIARIAKLVRRCATILISLDSDQYAEPTGRAVLRTDPLSTGAYRHLAFSLASVQPRGYIRRLPLPRGRHDYGEMPQSEIVSHLSNYVTIGFRGNTDGRVRYHKTSSEVLARC